MRRHVHYYELQRKIWSSAVPCSCCLGCYLSLRYLSLALLFLCFSPHTNLPIYVFLSSYQFSSFSVSLLQSSSRAFFVAFFVLRLLCSSVHSFTRATFLVALLPTYPSPSSLLGPFWFISSGPSLSTSLFRALVSWLVTTRPCGIAHTLSPSLMYSLPTMQDRLDEVHTRYTLQMTKLCSTSVGDDGGVRYVNVLQAQQQAQHEIQGFQ